MTRDGAIRLVNKLGGVRPIGYILEVGSYREVRAVKPAFLSPSAI